MLFVNNYILNVVFCFNKEKHKLLFIAFDLFFLASVVSIFVSDMPIPSFGEWRAFFLEPMVLFLMLIGRKDVVKATDLIWGLFLSTLSISVYAIVQKFTGWGIATPEWASEATRRVTAFFSSPNAVGLYLAPVAMLLIIIIYKKRRERGLVFWLLNIVCLLSLAAIFFTKS